MKKISCLLLALTIALSLSTAAFAAPATIKAGETKAVTLNEEQKITYSFTAKETGIYTLEGIAKNDCLVDCSIYNIENSDEILNGMPIYQDEEETNSVSFPAMKDSAFIIIVEEISYYYADEEDAYEYAVPAKFDLKLYKENVVSLRVNGMYTVTEPYAMFSFIPNESGYYNFRSSCKDDTFDPAVSIFDEMNNYDYNDDIGYENDFNFDLSTYCEAGNIYLVGTGAALVLEDEGADINFTFTVKKADNISPEYIYALENKISMARKDYYYTEAVIAPSGSCVNVDAEDITVTSSNPRVADVDGFELYGNIIGLDISSYRLGKTTITVELGNGESDKIVVRVRPRIIIIIERLLGMIFG